MANLVTCVRILCSIILLFSYPLSFQFYLIYCIAGISDMIDGTIARMTNSVSEFGSKLDTLADFIFIFACFLKLLPVVTLERRMYIWIGIILVIKIINVLSGYIIYKKVIAMHTIMNKVTGSILFAFPLTLEIIDYKYSIIVIGIVATFAAIQEGHFIRTRRI